jgi:L-rhamnose mutarotase
MNTAKRYCLTLSLKEDPDLISEYMHWHEKDHIWPEIPEGIRAVGIEQMEIYRFGSILFMIIEGSPEFDFEKDMKRLASFPGQQEWEAFVSKYQKSLPGETSSEKWKLMEKIFDLGQSVR